MNQAHQLMVRISDNVLECEQWSTAVLTLMPYDVLDDAGAYASTYVVTAQRQTNRGSYVLPRMRGWLLATLAEWSYRDPTGEHPETYHEIAVPHEGVPLKFGAFWIEEALAVALRNQRTTEETK